MTSELTNALNQILKWIKKNKPWYVKYLQPGLSRGEIENLVRDLQIQLPSEVYELYQWRNGASEGDLGQETAWLFQNWTFKPLQEVVAQYKKSLSNQPNRDLSRNQCNSYFSNFERLEIFYNPWQSQTGLILINTILDFCPVILEYFDEGDLSILQKYTSITTMMQTMAECYETGAYYIDPKVYEGYFISCHPQKEHLIWRKYNSKIIEFALPALQQGSLCGQFFIYFSQDLIEFKELRAVEPLVQALQKPIDLSGDFFNYINPKEEIAKILGELGDRRTVSVIISVLEDESDNWYYRTRVAAAKSLGQLKDKRATDSLLNALQDNISDVRRTAAWALGEIKDIKAVEPLSQLLGDEDNSVNEA
ncbi:MAG: HEAT repeat domain-containing protein, partial [Scytonema sp. PMC 1069.18]|nr:HEAT repeat domain-containing protein [Scytonema sp. PMC 1069.18]